MSARLIFLAVSAVALVIGYAGLIGWFVYAVTRVAMKGLAAL